MQVLIMINENLLFYTMFESLFRKKMNRIYYFHVQFNKKGREMKNTERHRRIISFSSVYIV